MNAANTFVLGNWKTVGEYAGPNGKEMARIKLELIDIDEH